MILPVQITFRNIVASPEIEKEITTRARKLEQFYSPITSCRVLSKRRGDIVKKAIPSIFEST